MNLDELTPEELVDGFVIPARMTREQKRRADEELAAVLQARRANLTEQEKLRGKLLQLKFQIEDYIKEDKFDPKKNFAYFLKSYVELQPRKKSEVASELSIHKSKLSQLLSGDREPSEDVFIRLEFHSNRFILARDWFRLTMKKHEHDIMTNAALRNQEKSYVKGHVELEGSVWVNSRK
jgi:transcriptional regulator with XRE-family HTH domain